MSHETLILFTRFPRPGRTKTRLAPVLGFERAAELQREMTEHVLGRIWPLVDRRGVNLQVRYADGSMGDMCRWLGTGIRFVAQGHGNLGFRMQRAVREAVYAGARSVVIIGADCPEVNATIVTNAFDLLQTQPLVFGPARDGGYYLIGLRQALPCLFENIEWGKRQVLADSLARARAAGFKPALLQELSDVDEPSDLHIWENIRPISRGISVIVPALNEAAHLPRALVDAAAGQPLEIIVADGGSRDDTPRIAEAQGAKVVACSPNRARQMNAGAAVARGEILLFLHADTLLPNGYREEVLEAFRGPHFVGGAFRFAIAEAFPGRWLTETATNLRSRLLGMPYGDQALFVRRWAFDQLGGFPALPIMEDYEFVRRLRRLGKLALLDGSVLTSGRRWQGIGFLRATLVNKLMILGYHCGVSPKTLAAFYRSQTKPSELQRANPTLAQTHRSNEPI
jgi:rSAM/selenodomain-associated transferase 2/rSAM/selenodomain-associated transferase 1